jgi:hypothetical protein
VRFELGHEVKAEATGIPYFDTAVVVARHNQLIIWEYVCLWTLDTAVYWIGLFVEIVVRKRICYLEGFFFFYNECFLVK